MKRPVTDIAVVILCLFAAISAAAQDSVRRRPWGDPDLEGMWTSATMTPLQRPTEGRRVLVRKQPDVELDRGLLRDDVGLPRALQHRRRNGGPEERVALRLAENPGPPFLGLERRGGVREPGFAGTGLVARLGLEEPIHGRREPDRRLVRHDPVEGAVRFSPTSIPNHRTLPFSTRVSAPSVRT